MQDKRLILLETKSMASANQTHRDRQRNPKPIPSKSYLLTPNRRGTITLPKELREGFTEDTVLKAVLRDDGVIELRPALVVDRNQSWFWTPRWQQMEREADEDIAAGRVKRFDSAEELFADLDAAT